MSKQHHENMDTLIKNVTESLHKALDTALWSGALTDELKESEDFRLAKTVFTAYMRNEPFRPWTDELRKITKNLEYFI